METKVDLLHEIWRQNRIREEEENRRIQSIKEEEDRKEQELQNFRTLLNQSRRWRQVKVLREFLADAEVRAISNNKLSEKFATWLEWATKKADWYDPYIEAEDSLLMEVDRENLVRAKKAMESFDWLS